MRPWLLLLSLLFSGLSPLGLDGEWVMDYSCWTLFRKVAILWTKTEHQCIHRNCVYTAVQHKQKTSPFSWTHTVHDNHGCSLSHQECTIIHRKQIPALVVSLLQGTRERVPTFLPGSDYLPALHVISESSCIAEDKDHPDSGCAWALNHRTDASGHNFQAFFTERSKSWAFATIVQKMLTKRYCSATTVIISCCFIKDEMRSVMDIEKISKKQISQIKQKGSTLRTMDFKILRKYDRQAAVSQQDVFQAAALNSGRSSMKTSDRSQLETQRVSVRIIKTNLNLLQKCLQRQHPLKAASIGKLLGPSQKTESLNRRQHKMKATPDDNKEDFSGKIITKQAEFKRPEGERETHANTIEKGNKKRLTYIPQAAHKTDNNDVDHKQMLTEAREVFIMLFLPDKERETKTEHSPQRKLILNTDTQREMKNLPIKEPDDPPIMTQVMRENSIIAAERLKESMFSLQMYDRAERIDIKPAESKVTPAYSEEQVKETDGKLEHTETNNTPHENMGINHAKQEENVPSEEPVVPSPPSLKMTAKTEHIAETTPVNTEIKETTSSAEVFNQGDTRKADRQTSAETPRTTKSPETETDAEPRCLKCKSGNRQDATEESFSGLRMRQDISADTNKLHEGTGTVEGEREEDQHDPKVNTFTFAKPSKTVHRQDTDTLLKATGDSVPLCRGLIHRTEAGWKHCTERSAGTGSKMVFSREPVDAGEQEKEMITDKIENPLNDDEYDHFYYFDGVLRKVANDFYPYYKRQRRRKRSCDNAENSIFTHENLLGFIRRLTLKNKAS